MNSGEPERSADSGGLYRSLWAGRLEKRTGSAEDVSCSERFFPVSAVGGFPDEAAGKESGGGAGWKYSGERGRVYLDNRRNFCIIPRLF